MKKLFLLSVSLLLITFVAKSQPVNFVWAKSMGGKGPDTNVGIARDTAGNLYITSEFVGTRTFGTFSLTAVGYSDIYVAKYSATGTCLWAVSGGTAFASAYGGKIAVSGNDLFVTGSFTTSLEFNGLTTYSNGGKDIFVAGFDATNGTCNWLNNAGSIIEDVPYGIETAAGGGFYLCGTFTGTATFGTNTVISSSLTDFDIFYARYTSQGACTWVNRIGSIGIDKALSIKQLPTTGDLVMTGLYEGTVAFGPGTTFTSEGGSDLFLAKFDSSGLFTWAFSGGSINNDIGYGVSYDMFDNIYTTGFIADTATFGSFVLNNNQGINVLVAKFTPSGTCSWAVMGGSVNDDIGYDIATDFGGSSFVTGYLNGNATFGSTQVTGVLLTDVFICKYDNTGTIRWITRAGGPDYDRGKAILAGTSGFCFAAGEFADYAAFGSTGLTAPAGTTCNFLTRVGGGTVGINEINNSPVSMYPNPAAGYVQLDLQEITDDAFTLSLFSLDGKVVMSKTLSRTDAVAGYKVDLENMASGNYLLKLETSQGDFSGTLVVQ